MAGQSGHNLSISKSKLGCRFPFESPSAGDGYAASGRCLTRPMTPEERARYGPPKPREEGNPFRSRFKQAIRVSKSPEEAAALLGMTVGKLNQHLGTSGLHPRWEKKEDETVKDTQENVDSAKQEPPKYYEGTSSAHRFTAERIAQTEELLSREEYIRLKSEGVSDQKIIKDRDKFSYELLLALKKK